MAPIGTKPGLGRGSFFSSSVTSYGKSLRSYVVSETLRLPAVRLAVRRPLGICGGL